MKRQYILLIASFLISYNINLCAQKNIGIKELSISEFKEQIWDFEKNKEFIFNGKKPVIINFYATWCGPCKAISPILDEIQKEYKGKIIIYKIDAEKEKEISQLFQTRAYPTLLFIPSKGDPQTFLGFKSKEELIRLIQSIFNK